jgi:hypothetical protein
VPVYPIPCSGRLLIAQLAAYGLAVVTDSPERLSLVSHDPDSLELAVSVEAGFGLEEVAARVRASAETCEGMVEADLEPGKTGNDRIPAIRARASFQSDPARAADALGIREGLIEELDRDGAALPMGLMAGLGAPAPWLRSRSKDAKARPQDGATQLDGVALNATSDIVRGALRPNRAAVLRLDPSGLIEVLSGRGSDAGEPDRFGWSPRGTDAHPVVQWLAALGMTVLPVGLASSAPARTPGAWTDRTNGIRRGITLPIFARPVSVARLRGVLQVPSLARRTPALRDAASLRSLGIAALAVFTIRESSNENMKQFTFDAAERLDL